MLRKPETLEPGNNVLAKNESLCQTKSMYMTHSVNLRLDLFDRWYLQTVCRNVWNIIFTSAGFRKWSLQSLIKIKTHLIRKVHRATLVKAI